MVRRLQRNSYSQGQRVLKEAADTVNPSRFSAEVFDSLRLNSALYRAGDNEYDRTPATETVYLAGIAVSVKVDAA
jgi:hypothetical protein